MRARAGTQRSTHTRHPTLLQRGCTLSTSAEPAPLRPSDLSRARTPENTALPTSLPPTLFRGVGRISLTNPPSTHSYLPTASQLLGSSICADLATTRSQFL
jgi:hypothetical protein